MGSKYESQITTGSVSILQMTIRMACVPLGARGLCRICKLNNLPVSHVFTHTAIGNGNGLASRIMNIINEQESIRLLKMEDQEELKTLWVLYKNKSTI